LSPAALDCVLRKLTPQFDPNVIVGFDTADDAGVYRIRPDLALVQTVDFFTPIVDDPFSFGQIAAVNALSDVYAMGGQPLTALAMVCFPEREDLEVLGDIMAGGLSKMIEAGCTVLGGHSIRDPEIKFGYSVMGSVHSEGVFTNAGAKPGDRLILTKAIGTGTISTAIKKQEIPDAWIRGALKSMTTLNKVPIDVIKAGDFSVHAMTDITGFGLVGHAREMAVASKVRLTLYTSEIPLLEGALECIERDCIPGGTHSNREFAGKDVEYVSAVPEQLKALLFDPQTAGGLLISVSESDVNNLLQRLREEGVCAAEIGAVFSQGQDVSARITIV
jgi:selenide,water dikinase